MGLAIMIVGLALFIGAHVFITMRGPRAAVIARMGEWPYKGVISVISLIGIIVIGYGFARYRAAGMIDVWHPPAWTRHLNNALMWPAIVCIVAAYSPGEIKRVLKHPMLVGVKLWAVAHLVANGDLGSIILFVSILLWAGYDRMTIKNREDHGGVVLPIGGRGNDIVAVVVGTLLYLALGYWFHPYVIGVAAFVR
jgi:uncharacterized membrane protein